MANYMKELRESLNPTKRNMPLFQTGSAAIIINEEGRVLLQLRSDRDMWGLPGGCQELGETFEEVIIREVKEETNLDIKEEDLILIGLGSGKKRFNVYPNGDQVYNVTALYLIKKYNGNIKIDEESKEMRFFKLNEIPKNNVDYDMIDMYIKYLDKIK